MLIDRILELFAQCNLTGEKDGVLMFAGLLMSENSVCMDDFVEVRPLFSSVEEMENWLLKESGSV